MAEKEQLPLILTVEDIAAIMRVSRNTAYEFARSKGFPSTRVGRQIRIERDRFFKWLDKQLEEGIN